MDNHSQKPFSPAEKVRKVVDALVESIAPERILLFSQKANLTGEISSFKLCLVVDTDDKDEVELFAYLSIDSPIPFDVLVYTPVEWNELISNKNSFANRIYQTGVLLYER